ncbi:PDDEXK nuclease domain-containing protein [Rubrolithibacter danxiaensis]|uniref:PDDEXK nuclease domain-containing protein n=1 Tax=Rubrolithibacter danxiaensis TaxID=3390805 RepID=UPI003BF91AD3
MKAEKDKPALLQNIRSLIVEAQKIVVRNVNTMMVLTYFQIGKMIVEDEQQGQDRAAYADKTIVHLSKALSNEFGRGYSKSNLEYMRVFFITYQNRITQSVIGQFEKSVKTQLLIGQLKSAFSLSWTHYIQLLKIKDEDERDFYEIEATQNNWSVRELQRQYNSALFERLALGKDKKGIKRLAEKGQILEKPIDALKSHYVLEFLELKEDSRYSESDLERAIINKLEHFMLELGKGFLFEGRQRRFTFEGDSFFVDLVFYNRLLKCFVLFDLKIGKLTHQDIGQMQMYVNYYDRKIKLPEERPTIGIILCKEENRTVIEFTLPENNEQIFAKEYKSVLPSKAELKKQIE